MTNRMIHDPYSTWWNAAAECTREFEAWIGAPITGRSRAHAHYRDALDREEVAARDLAVAMGAPAPPRGRVRRRTGLSPQRARPATPSRPHSAR